MWRFAIQNLFSRPVRSSLALAGLSVAITGMVGLFSVAEGIDQMVTQTFGRIPGLAIMQAGAPIPLFSRIPAAWGDEIATIEGVNVVNPEIWTRVNVIEGKRVIAPPRLLFGTGIETRSRLNIDVFGDSIVEGRFLDESDKGQPHAVISRMIAEEHEVGVGDTLQVNSDDLEIVGIYHSGLLMLDVTIIIDIDMLRRFDRFDSDTVCAFYVEQHEGVDDEKLAEAIRERFRGREIQSRGLVGAFATGHPLIDLLLAIFNWTGGGVPSTAVPAVDGQAEPIEVRTWDDWSQRFDEFSGDLNMFLSVITGIGVVVAVLSIVNTMLMSVTERIIEFGILKANGWTRRDVLLLITCESAVLGVIGGVAGCLLGYLGTQVVNASWPERIQLYASPMLLGFSFLFSSSLGVLGGLYPAIWAMRLSPMDAIRRG